MSEDDVRQAVRTIARSGLDRACQAVSEILAITSGGECAALYKLVQQAARHAGKNVPAEEYRALLTMLTYAPTPIPVVSAEVEALQPQFRTMADEYGFAVHRPNPEYSAVLRLGVGSGSGFVRFALPQLEPRPAPFVRPRGESYARRATEELARLVEQERLRMMEEAPPEAPSP